MTSTANSASLAAILRENLARQEAAGHADAEDKTMRARASRLEVFRADLGQARYDLTRAIKNGVTSPVIVAQSGSDLYIALDSMVCAQAASGNVLFHGDHPLLAAWYEFSNWVHAEQLELHVQQFVNDGRADGSTGQFAIRLLLPEAVQG